MAAYSDYPVELVGYYEERVNRLLWLIKWLLIIPHAIVLWFLSIPTILTIPVAWVAIIIMGRYPSFLWGYHTGLLRWTWLVNFYSYGAGATDRYPPFSFQSRDDYPADFNIKYPETLSRLSTLVPLAARHTSLDNHLLPGGHSRHTGVLRTCDRTVLRPLSRVVVRHYHGHEPLGVSRQRLWLALGGRIPSLQFRLAPQVS